MTRSRTTRAAIALTASAALAASAASGTGATGTTRSLSAKPGEALAFSVKRLSAPAGKLTLRMTNRDDIAHDIAVRGRRLAKPRKGRIVGPGEVSTLTVTLPAGTYTFYCTVFGHEGSGMRGTLVVRK